MQRWTIDLNTADWQAAPEAQAVCAALLNGDLVAVPTETVYGLTADATNGTACAKIFKAKGRPQFNPLISHVASLEAAREHGNFDGQALALAEAFWPGPLTLVVPKKETSPISDLATAGLQTVALRVPDGPVMRYLSERINRPLAAPSANRSGKISPTRAEDVIADLGPSLSFVIDAGPCPVGIESTIVGCIDGTTRLLRPGGLSREAIEKVLGAPLSGADARMAPDAPTAPGMLSSHYAPNASMILNASHASPDDGLLSFGPDPLPGAGQARAEINLSPSGDLTEAAANLFQAMRALDASGVKTIRVQFIPSFGLGEAINDRLRRAAAPRV
ncbi:L-threonylcarbamoyladenylate synthase [Roseibium salinum]|uniref:Threonylcarbamoyl-AMP synthase n=1 Tax=Roseibium salinum TaxID=1604349 RepID=A0ABT3R3F3_9HYPH|nr:L-threonylcarbamoyladenylate synthase [Roseibium sp. DSM 29163]MCX2723704.1 L-threonylcarbamoyladenylate synthase [Roseibium sp. DSM 29163]